jgi:hypothetical protein
MIWGETAGIAGERVGRGGPGGAPMEGCRRKGR